MPVILNTGVFAKNSSSQSFDTGFVNFGTFFNSPTIGSTPWFFPERAVTLDAFQAQNAAGSVLVTHYCVGTNLQTPPLPPTAIVTGIQVRHSSQRFNIAFENTIRLFQSGAAIGSNRSNGSLLQGFLFGYLPTNGGVSDLWGAGPITGADINDSTFGVGIAHIMFASGGGLKAVIIGIDHMQMRVFYTAFT